MNFKEFDNTIFIVKDHAKSGLLKLIRNEKSILNIKVLTLTELKKKWFFDYNKETEYYICKKYGVISNIAKVYLENMYYVDHAIDIKTSELLKIKQDLQENNLLKITPGFHGFLTNKTIVLYELENIDNFYKNIFTELEKSNKLVYYTESTRCGIKKLYRANNKEEEISFVASSIVRLIKKGIDINKIFLANVNKEYYATIETIFKEFNIPVVLPNISSINGSIIVRNFKKLYSKDMGCVFEALEEHVKNKDDEKIYKLLLNIVNDYAWCNNYIDVKDLIFDDISDTRLSDKKLKNAVRTIDFASEIIDSSDYVFLINFNQGVIPIDYKDEDYLSDEFKKKLGISTSIDLNMKAIREIQNKIKSTNNLIVSMSKYDLTQELYISNAYDESLFIEDTISVDYTLSNAFNKRVLLCAKDDYKKYGDIKDALKLDSVYKDYEYESYKNDFTGVSSLKIKEKLKNKLQLSYTSMNTYYQCGFRYYLDYVLKMNKYEDSFLVVVGRIFHSVLSKAFNEHFDFDMCWGEEIEKEEYVFNNMEKFFLTNLKDELLFVIDTIKEQSKYTSLKKALYEKEIVIDVDKENSVTFKGIVDKTLYDEIDGENYAVLIDYKTGEANLSLGGMPYGLNMQLPTYVYLLMKSGIMKNVKIGGFYLQKIIDNTLDKEKKTENLKLMGYSNRDISILEKVDSSYTNSKIIKSLKTTSTGFSSYSKLLSSEKIDKLTDCVDDNIRRASKGILNGEFSINPKELDGKLIGCQFCQYKDICFMKNADIVKLKGASNEELLGGEIDA